MASPRNILLAAALMASASAIVRTNLDHASYNRWETAAAYDGPRINLDYYTAPSADIDLHKLHEVKAVVMRLYHTAIEFTPHEVVLNGASSPPDCFKLNRYGQTHDRIGAVCRDHCMNIGRYCDLAAFMPELVHDFHDHSRKGHELVKESARRSCLWHMKKPRGRRAHDEIYNYFQYHDAIKGTGCYDTLDDTCVEQALNTVGFEMADVNECIGDIGVNVDSPNPLLEIELEEAAAAESHTLPAIFINGEEKAEFEHEDQKQQEGLQPDSLLKMICDALPNDPDVPKPKICDFCLHYCPTKAKGDFDMATCLWDLKCGDDHKGFTTFLQEYNTAHPDADAAIFTPPAQSSTASSTSDSSSSSSGTSEGLGIIATIMAVIFAAGASALAIMAIRVWRTKMIIDRYVKEQQAINSGDYGRGGHHDPILFPEDAELDLDLEPALQYSDHIAPAPAPPQQANFLPQLS